MDSLRYWVTECHVDGFRFDLATALARELYDVDRLSALLRRDPPGPGALPGQADRRALGRRPGRLPGRQLPGPVVGVERHLPRRRCATSGAARRASASSPRASPGSSDLYQPTAATRSPRSTSSPPTTASRCATSSPTTRSTTRPTCEDNQTAPTTTAPGTAAPRATTDDPEILALRARQQRNFLATLLLSQGVPMLLGGDEFGRTQDGNNNAWCQDNEISWFDWDRHETRRASCVAFTRRLIALRREHPVLPPRATSCRGDRTARACPTSGGSAPTAADDPARLGTARRVPRRVPQRRGDPRPTPRASRIIDDSFLLLFNAHHEDVEFTLPSGAIGACWALELSTADPRADCRSASGTAPRAR